MPNGYRELFKRHSEDLRHVCPEAEDAFVCPICFAVFLASDFEEHLARQRIGFGHIWPKRVRTLLRWSMPKKVLLCQHCNSKAGARGDAMIDILEQIKEGDTTGQLPGERSVQIMPTPGKKPIAIRALVTERRPHIGKGGSFHLEFSIARNNPDDLKRLDEFVEQGKDCAVIVPPHPQVAIPVGQVGLLTSAYLLAFCTLGYKYTFQSCLDPIREYVLASFDNSVDDRLEFEESKDVCVSACSKCNRVDPEILFVIIPDRPVTPRHLEISFLNYHVRLPVPPDSFSIKIPDDVLSELRRTYGEHMCIVASCTNPNAEALFGEVDYRYCVEQHRIKPRLRSRTSRSEQPNGA